MAIGAVPARIAPSVVAVARLGVDGARFGRKGARALGPLVLVQGVRPSVANASSAVHVANAAGVAQAAADAEPNAACDGVGRAGPLRARRANIDYLASPFVGAPHECFREKPQD